MLGRPNVELSGGLSANCGWLYGLAQSEAGEEQRICLAFRGRWAGFSWREANSSQKVEKARPPRSLLRVLNH